jgi:hypothetical protein
LHELDPALSGGRWAILVRATPAPPVRPADQIAANAAAILSAAARDCYQRFIADHQDGGLPGLHSLSLQTWLLARNRALHALWLAGLPPDVVDPAAAGRFAAVISEGWRRAMEMSYIALRRVRSGRKAPGAAFTAIESVAHAEVSLARSLLSGTPDGGT